MALFTNAVRNLQSDTQAALVTFLHTIISSHGSQTRIGQICMKSKTFRSWYQLIIA